MQEEQVYLADLSNGRDLRLSLSRSFFQEMCDDLFQKCMDEVDELLAEPGRSGDWPPPLKVLHVVETCDHFSWHRAGWRGMVTTSVMVCRA